MVGGGNYLLREESRSTAVSLNHSFDVVPDIVTCIQPLLTLYVNEVELRQTKGHQCVCQVGQVIGSVPVRQGQLCVGGIMDISINYKASFHLIQWKLPREI